MHTRIIIHLLFVFCILKNNDKPSKSAGMLPSKILQGWGDCLSFLYHCFAV